MEKNKNNKNLSLLYVSYNIVSILKLIIHSLGFMMFTYFIFLYLQPKLFDICMEGLSTNFDNLWWIHVEKAILSVIFNSDTIQGPVVGELYHLKVIKHHFIDWMITVIGWWVMLCHQILCALFGPFFVYHKLTCFFYYLTILSFVYILFIIIKIVYLKLNAKENMFRIKLWLVILDLFYVIFFCCIAYIFSFILLLNFKIMLTYLLFSSLFIVFNHYRMIN